MVFQLLQKLKECRSISLENFILVYNKSHITHFDIKIKSLDDSKWNFSTTTTNESSPMCKVVYVVVENWEITNEHSQCERILFAKYRLNINPQIYKKKTNNISYVSQFSEKEATWRSKYETIIILSQSSLLKTLNTQLITRIRITRITNHLSYSLVCMCWQTEYMVE